MIYDHKVKNNGIWYLPGENIPDGAEPITSGYTKTEIYRMPVDDLRALSVLNGIDNAENINGTDLKKILIEKLGL